MNPARQHRKPSIGKLTSSRYPAIRQLETGHAARGSTSMSGTALVVLAIAAGLVIIVAVLASRKPPRFVVSRSVRLEAPRDSVLPFINDLRRWPEWSEAGIRDKATARSYLGADSGPGAIGEWEGEGRGGKVRLEIIEASPTSVRVQADWSRPFVARNFNQFNLAPDGNGTRVTWTLDGETMRILKVMTVFVSPDRLMGRHLEHGLAALRTAVESPAS